ncbi:MAG: hypothetical protein AAB517_02380 [Patescibacteria group bacterium]
MLTKDDKKFLTEKFAAKDDLKSLVTKKEHKELRDSIDLLRNKLTMSSLEKFDFKSRVDSIEASSVRTEEKVDKILDILDGFSGKVAELDQENKMGERTLHRHGIQIQELAKATGTTLSK